MQQAATDQCFELDSTPTTGGEAAQERQERTVSPCLLSSRSAPGDLAIQPSALSDAATSHDLSFYHSTASLLDRFTAMAKGTLNLAE